MYDIRSRKIVKTEKIQVSTKGNTDIIDITQNVNQAIAQSEITNGIAVIFNVGSTAGITTIEFEPGLATCDMKVAFEKIAPENGEYLHEKTWHDDNGHSHVRASLLGPSITVPIMDGQLTLGTWQQIVLIDFDTRGRNRTVVCQMMGE